MVKNLRQAKQETTKGAPLNIQWQLQQPTEAQHRNFERAVFRWCINNGMQKAPLHRSKQ